MQIKVFIPEDQEKSQEAIKRVLKTIIKHSGGATVYPQCSGYWKDDSGVLVHDNISVIETYYSSRLYAGVKIVKTELVKELLIIRELLNQDCIAYCIDNEIYFV